MFDPYNADVRKSASKVPYFGICGLHGFKNLKHTPKRAFWTDLSFPLESGISQVKWILWRPLLSHSGVHNFLSRNESEFSDGTTTIQVQSVADHELPANNHIRNDRTYHWHGTRPAHQLRWPVIVPFKVCSYPALAAAVFKRRMLCFGCKGSPSSATYCTNMQKVWEASKHQQPLQIRKSLLKSKPISHFILVHQGELVHVLVRSQKPHNNGHKKRYVLVSKIFNSWRDKDFWRLCRLSTTAYDKSRRRAPVCAEQTLFPLLPPSRLSWNLPDRLFWER